MSGRFTKTSGHFLPEKQQNLRKNTATLLPKERLINTL